MAKIMDPGLPILSILEYRAIILGSLGGPGTGPSYRGHSGGLRNATCQAYLSAGCQLETTISFPGSCSQQECELQGFAPAGLP